VNQWSFSEEIYLIFPERKCGLVIISYILKLTEQFFMLRILEKLLEKLFHSLKKMWFQFFILFPAVILSYILNLIENVSKGVDKGASFQVPLWRQDLQSPFSMWKDLVMQHSSSLYNVSSNVMQICITKKKRFNIFFLNLLRSYWTWESLVHLQLTIQKPKYCILYHALNCIALRRCTCLRRAIYYIVFTNASKVLIIIFFFFYRFYVYKRETNEAFDRHIHFHAGAATTECHVLPICSNIVAGAYGLSHKIYLCIA